MAKKISLSSVAIKFLGSAGITVLLTSYFGLAGAVRATEVRNPHTSHDTGEYLKPTGKGWGEHDPTGMTFGNAQKFSRTSTNGISYHGGPVILNTVNMYYIWYGKWDFSTTTTDSATKNLLNTFGTSIGGTNYFKINTTYYSSSPTTYVSGLVALPNTTVDASYSQGSALNDTAVETIVANALASGALGNPDPNGVYFVLTSKEVTETSGFCTQYCAWHTHGLINNTDIKYGFVGDPAQCPSACSVQTTTPNGNFAADAMANLIAHELAESTTDPDLNAWYDTRGYENADKCAWKFGTTYPASNGAQYNVTWGTAPNTTNWLIQQNWINKSGGYCTLTN